MPQHGDGPSPGRRQVGQPDRLLSQLDADNLRSGRSLQQQPAAGIPAGPVHTGRPTEGVPASERLGYPGQPGHGQARADRVAGAEQGAEVGAVQRPERGGDEMVPALVTAGDVADGIFPAGS